MIIATVRSGLPAQASTNRPTGHGRWGRTTVLLALVLIWFDAVAAAPAAAITPTITEFSAGLTHNGDPSSITPGPDGNLWFLEYASPGRIGKITPSGTINEVATGGVTPNFSANTQPAGIVTGPDGNLWITEGRNPGGIAKIDPATGAVSVVATGGVTPGFSVNSGPQGIVVGRDGNLWFAEDNPPGAIARITPAGVVTEFSSGLTPNSGPDEITVGPDGNLWFTEINNPARIGRINPTTGVINEFSTGLTPAGGVFSIVGGPDGNLWFTELNNPGRIGKISTAGVITEVATGGVTPGLSANSTPGQIVPGPDGHLWFTEASDPSGPGRIGRIDPGAGSVVEFPLPTSDSGPIAIALGPDGNLWFTEFAASQIGRITTPPTASTTGATATGATSATVAGVADGHAQATSFHVEYGPLGGATTTAPEQAVGTTTADTAVSSGLTHLQPATTYQARIVVTNPTGTTAGAFRSFTTRSQRPVLSRVSQSARKWREGHSLPHISRKHPLPIGTTFSFSMNEPARVMFAFTQSASGRAVGGKCVAPTGANKHRRKCTLTRTIATLSFSRPAGLSRVRFQGRLSRRKELKPGRYTLVIRATNGAHQTSAPALLHFTIVKR